MFDVNDGMRDEDGLITPYIFLLGEKLYIYVKMNVFNSAHYPLLF